MGRTLRIPDAQVLRAMDVPTQYVVLAALFALRGGASALRFEKRSGMWDVLSWLGGEWQVGEPMKEEAQVDRAVRSLARPPGLRGLVAAVFGGDGGGEFGFRLAFGAEVRCAVGELRLGEGITLLLRCEGDAAEQVAELLDDYLRLIGP